MWCGARVSRREYGVGSPATRISPPTDCARLRSPAYPAAANPPIAWLSRRWLQIADRLGHPVPSPCAPPSVASRASRRSLAQKCCRPPQHPLAPAIGHGPVTKGLRRFDHSDVECRLSPVAMTVTGNAPARNFAARSGGFTVAESPMRCAGRSRRSSRRSRLSARCAPVSCRRPHAPHPRSRYPPFSGCRALSK